jgi:hypothetical protein
MSLLPYTLGGGGKGVKYVGPLPTSITTHAPPSPPIYGVIKLLCFSKCPFHLTLQKIVEA